MSFESALKVEKQQSGCYNLVAWEIKKKHEYTEVDSQLSWLAWRYKEWNEDFLFAHITAENAAVCVTKVGHVNTLSIKKANEKKEIEEGEEEYRWRFW